MEKDKKYFYRTWIARDSNGYLYSYHEKPEKDVSTEEWDGMTGLPSEYFKSVRWADAEPTRAVIISEKKLSKFIEEIAKKTLRCEYTDLDKMIKDVMKEYCYGEE